MRYIYTRPTREAGWSWLTEDGHNADGRYQFLVPLLNRIDERKSAYYVCTSDHKVLELHKMRGKKVDERDNFIATVEQQTAYEDEYHGRRLIYAILWNYGSFSVPESKLLPALVYASRRLPACYSERIQLCEEDYPGMMSIDFTGNREPVPDIPEGHWLCCLPEFGEREEKIAEKLRSDNGGYIPENLVQFFAYINGARFEVQWQSTFTSFFGSGDLVSFKMIERYIHDILPTLSDPYEVFTVVRNYPRENWADLWAEVSLYYDNKNTRIKADAFAGLDTLRNPMDTYPYRFREAVRSGLPIHLSLSEASPADLHEIYIDAEYMEVPAAELPELLGTDDNSASLIGLYTVDGEVTGILAAVLYVYGEITLRECIGLYGGDKELAKNMIERVTEQCLPPLLQKKALKKITALITKE